MARVESFRTVGRGALDSKSRISLTRVIRELVKVLGTGNLEGLTFKIQVNDAGQVLLSPEVSIPACEAWLYRNPQALAAVHSGLREAEQGPLVKRGAFAGFEDDEID